MSLIWKLGIGGVRLFTKLSSNEIECNACDPKKKIKLHDGSTTKATSHVSQHPEYKKQLDDLREQERKKTETQQKQMTSFLNNDISSDDRKIIEFIACTNQPFATVEHETFKRQCGVKGLKGRHFNISN